MSLPEPLRISLIQSDIEWENVDANLRSCTRKIENLAGKTDIIVLPEMFATGFSMNSAQIAQPSSGTICTWLKEISRTCQCAIAGGVAISSQRTGAAGYYNTLVWTEPDGTQQYYDKRHLFRMAGEHTQYSAGSTQQTIDYKGWRISPFVCYDLRFPVWSRNAALLDNKSIGFRYDCALYIANWPASRSLHWCTLLRARAIENQCYVIGVNRVGKDAKGSEYSGDSVAISPQGIDIAALEPSAEQVATVVLDAADLDRYRTKFPFILDADAFEVGLL